MKRFTLVLGAWILFPLMAYAASQMVVPWPATVVDHVPYIAHITEIALTAVCFFAALLSFEVVYHGYRRSLFRALGVSLISRVKARHFVAKSRGPLAEVQRTGRGTVGISRV